MCYLRENILLAMRIWGNGKEKGTEMKDGKMKRYMDVTWKIKNRRLLLYLLNKYRLRLRYTDSK